MPEDQKHSGISRRTRDHLSTANDIELIASECDANDYIRKPFDVEDMVVKVTRILNYQPLAI